MTTNQSATKPENTASRVDPREKVTARAVGIWLVALLVYIVAITGRTSLGVAGVQALDHFHINASQLAVFTAVQVGVYAFAQIPTGLIIDRIGARKTMMAGALIMGLGQLLLALTTSYPLAIVARVLIGAGDATAFLGAMRLLPSWFPLRATPLFTQLTAGVGQLGQFLSAVPFLALLHASGWVPAFASLAAAGVLISIISFIALADSPFPEQESAPKANSRLSIGQTLQIVVTEPVCWQGFFTHWTGLMHQAIFTLLWGMPLMTLGLGLAPAQASVVLVINTLTVIAAGPFMGMVSARASRARIWAIGIIGALSMIAWFIFLAQPTAPDFVGVLLLNIAMGALAPMSNLGFDSVREHVQRTVLATGTGLANMGGFIATMIASQGIGLLLDFSAHGKDYTWPDFRLAWVAVIVIWVIGMLGLVLSEMALRRKKRRKFTLA